MTGNNVLLSGAERQGGFALVAVLLAVSVLSLIALSVMSSATVSYHLETNLSRRAEAQAAADAGIRRAILALTDPRIGRRWSVDGIPRDFSFAGRRVTVSIQDELGKIDLNTAGVELLRGALRGSGLSPEKAAALADRILDWREAAAARRLEGAKADDYRRAGYHYVPRNGPFQSIDELQLVMGVTPELFARLAPALTVYSGRQFIDAATAPREALLALPGMDEDKVDAVLEARRVGQDQAPDRATLVASGVVGPSVSLDGRAFTVKAEVDDAGATASRRATVRLTGDPKRPYWILSWR